MKARIQIFARAPQPGLAKTRLIPALGATGAAALHAQFIRHTLTTASHTGLALELWCHPDSRHAFFSACARDFTIELYNQQGADLGMRMQHALHTGLDDGDAVILIGTDCPALSPADLQHALAALEQGNDAVLGPAHDGGYYLIGLRRPLAGLFDAMPWGSAKVLALTRQRLQQTGRRWHELDVLHDIDTPDDLSHVPGALLRKL